MSKPVKIEMLTSKSISANIEVSKEVLDDMVLAPSYYEDTLDAFIGAGPDWEEVKIDLEKYKKFIEVWEIQFKLLNRDFLTHRIEEADYFRCLMKLICSHLPSGFGPNQAMEVVHDIVEEMVKKRKPIVPTDAENAFGDLE